MGSHGLLPLSTLRSAISISRSWHAADSSSAARTSRSRVMMVRIFIGLCIQQKHSIEQPNIAPVARYVAE